MAIEFKNKKVLNLYTKGKHRNYPLSADLLDKFFMRIQQLEAAVYDYDLRSPALHFEKLAGHKNRYSVRLNKKWRLEFAIDWQDKDKGLIGTIHILEVSNHYGD